jgi:hypothetical protein
VLVQSLELVSLDTFKEAVFQAVTNKINSVAPLGYSSPTILLYGNEGNERRSGISVRNHSGTISLLICDNSGSFIFHGGYDKRLPIDFISLEYWRVFKKVKKYITQEMPKKKEAFVDHPFESGFEFLAAAQRGCFMHC